MTLFKRAWLATFISIALGSTCASAQTSTPFGIGAGTPLSELTLAEDFVEGTRRVLVTPPIRNPLFDRFAVSLSPELTVCSVRAIRSGQNAEMAETFESLHAEIQKLYSGASHIRTWHFEGPDPDMPEATAYLAGQLRYDFDVTKGLHEDLYAIYASMQREGAEDVVTVIYTFRGFPECGARQSEADKSAGL